jgi:hypothetical protein
MAFLHFIFDKPVAAFHLIAAAEKTFTTSDVITLIVAIIGALLGILNFIRDWLRQRQRLRVILGLYYVDATNLNRAVFIDSPDDENVKARAMDGSLLVSLRIINHSDYSVFVAWTGFESRRPKKMTVLLKEQLADEEKPHREIDARKATMVFTNLSPKQVFEIGDIAFAFAQTPTGKIYRGSSPIWKFIRKHIKARSR